jgi:hypothetical protein
VRLVCHVMEEHAPSFMPVTHVVVQLRGRSIVAEPPPMAPPPYVGVVYASIAATAAATAANAGGDLAGAALAAGRPAGLAAGARSVMSSARLCCRSDFGGQRVRGNQDPRCHRDKTSRPCG